MPVYTNYVIDISLVDPPVFVLEIKKGAITFDTLLCGALTLGKICDSDHVELFQDWDDFKNMYFTLDLTDWSEPDFIRDT